jgi:hypothetical protein
VLTYGSTDKDGSTTQGGYSTHVVVTEDFVVRIPDGLALDQAAPLLCAGITTYSPLRRWGAGPGRSRSDHMDDAAASGAQRVQLDAELLAVAPDQVEVLAGDRVGDGLSEVVGWRGVIFRPGE